MTLEILIHRTLSITKKRFTNNTYSKLQNLIPQITYTNHHHQRNIYKIQAKLKTKKQEKYDTLASQIHTEHTPAYNTILTQKYARYETRLHNIQKHFAHTTNIQDAEYCLAELHNNRYIKRKAQHNKEFNNIYCQTIKQLQKHTNKRQPYESKIYHMIAKPMRYIVRIAS